MKLEISKEWFAAAVEREGDSEIGAGNPNFASEARILQLEKALRIINRCCTCEHCKKIIESSLRTVADQAPAG